MCDRDASRFDYAWLIPQWKPLHRLYHFTERHPWSYQATKLLWIVRYYWRRHQVEAGRG